MLQLKKSNVVNKYEYIGKKISWDDMVKYFPDRWVVINDYTIQKGNVDKATIIDVLTDEEVSSKRSSYTDMGYECLRTTDNCERGFIEDRRDFVMSAREREVLNMQLVLIPILSKAWKLSYSELSTLFNKYDVLGYIDVCYEKYNSTGNQGIIDDLKEYIELQGGIVA